MKQIKTLYIGFENPIKQRELRAFRSAIIEKAGRKHVLFHNHLDEDKFLYTYPRIQYKIVNNQPAIVCIEEGIDEIHHFFSKPSWDLMLYDRLYNVKVNKLLINKFNMQVWDAKFNYKIYNWHALNQNNYKIYKELTEPEQQHEMLRKILVGNILAFAKGIRWTIEKEILVNIDQIIRTKSVKLKDARILCFDMLFSTNVFLPNYIGLGKNVSYGFGIVKQVKQKKNEP